MLDVNEVQSNHFNLRDLCQQCECGQIREKCRVDNDRISAALDLYYVNFQRLESVKNKYKSVVDNISSVLLRKETNTSIKSATITFNSTSYSEDAAVTKTSFDKQMFNHPRVLTGDVSSDDRLPDKSEGKNLSYFGKSELCHSVAVIEAVDRPYRCSECKMAFKRNLHLKRHFVVTHTLKKNFSCAICNKLFSRKDYLDKHIGTHQKKDFKLKLLQQGIVVRTKMQVKISV